MMLNRQDEPAIKPLENFNPPAIFREKLSNGVPVFLIPGGRSGVVRIEWIFKAGKWYESANLQADLCSRMLREGTLKHQAAHIASFFDGYGSNFSTAGGFEQASVSLYTLSRFAGEQLGMIREIIEEPAFPEKELNTILSNRRQRLSIDLEKNDFLANRAFCRHLFGPKHPYGRVTEADQLENRHPEELKDFHQKYYRPENMMLLICGDYSPVLLSALDQLFGKSKFSGSTIPKPAHPVEGLSEKVYHLDRPQAVQTSLMAGGRTILKTHPDYHKLFVLNTVYGGYFGSRLMSNIREEKGYTYGIYSSLASYPHDSFIEISADVGKEVRSQAMEEIGREMEILRKEAVDTEELEIVKNYLEGKLLRSTDGPYKMGDALKNLIATGQDENYFREFLTALHTITPEDLLKTAETYFDFAQLYKISVG
jgi:zinc protease